MPKLKFPVVKGNHRIFPRKPLCPMCGKRKVYEPHSMAIINAGAMRKVGKARYEMADDDAALFSLIWHGAHPSTGGIGKDADIHANVEIAKMVESGQFDLYFCSTDCLRAFLNACVDELERRIESARRKGRRVHRARQIHRQGRRAQTPH